ncbi:MAG: class GN sortase [Gammaproteobacteria bacterium HGW-Gammaproteobacteria-11]|nr:MAG: class GN sortase [Gammaproteobacteria bacterium HGW-Gammaproteobacteria-11]
MSRRLRHGLAGVLLLAAAGLAGQACWLQAKAIVAQYLIADAWEQSLLSGEPVKPWRWADTWPVARLTEPGGRHHYVLASVSGEALAFGPGHHPASALPGEAATVLLAGHQDSHFAFLQHLKAGDLLRLQDLHGNEHAYRVSVHTVVDSSQQSMHFHQDLAELRLVTCYPFASLHSGGPLRYVVSALLEPST